MATYLGTHGSKIQNYTTDPDNPNTGEVWYNETNNVLKFQFENVSAAGSWSTGGNMNTARRHMSGFGTYTSAIANGGWSGPPAYYGNTELWNGTNWTEVNDLNTARRYLANSGVSNTSGLAFGGYVPGTEDVSVTELWNGTNWTEVNDLNQKRNNLAGAGTSTSALAMDGFLNAPLFLAIHA